MKTVSWFYKAIVYADGQVDPIGSGYPTLEECQASAVAMWGDEPLRPRSGKSYDVVDRVIEETATRYHKIPGVSQPDKESSPA